MAEKLRQPVTVEQEYLAAILDEIRGLKDRLIGAGCAAVTNPLPSPGSPLVELRESVKRKSKR